MEKHGNIPRPEHDMDVDGARNVFVEFTSFYAPLLHRAEHYLATMIENAEPGYASAYRPWHRAIKNLLDGAESLSKENHNVNIDRFVEVLHMFTFNSSALFIFDLCRNAKIRLPRNWNKRFQEDINLMLFSIAIINGELLTEND